VAPAGGGQRGPSRARHSPLACSGFSMCVCNMPCCPGCSQWLTRRIGAVGLRYYAEYLRTWVPMDQHPMDIAHYARGLIQQHISLESVRRTKHCIYNAMMLQWQVHLKTHAQRSPWGLLHACRCWKSGKSSLIWNHTQANPTVDDATLLRQVCHLDLTLRCSTNERSTLFNGVTPAQGGLISQQLR
jgi:hypothetical protein